MTAIRRTTSAPPEQGRRRPSRLVTAYADHFRAAQAHSPKTWKQELEQLASVFLNEGHPTRSAVVKYRLLADEDSSLSPKELASHLGVTTAAIADHERRLLSRLRRIVNPSPVPLPSHSLFRAAKQPKPTSNALFKILYPRGLLEETERQAVARAKAALDRLIAHANNLPKTYEASVERLENNPNADPAKLARAKQKREAAYAGRQARLQIIPLLQSEPTLDIQTLREKQLDGNLAQHYMRDVISRLIFFAHQPDSFEQ